MFGKFKQARNAMRGTGGLETAFVPDGSVVLDAPSAAERAAVDAVMAGDPRPAGELLDGTRRAGQWDAHSQALGVLAQAALAAPLWLPEWAAAEPDSASAALVRARVGVEEAWRQRGATRGRDVEPARMEAFQVLLAETTDLIGRAADLAAEDPEPWNLALIHARGLGAPREAFGDYLSRLRELDPGHYWGHRSALEFVTAKWYGSHDEAYAFADAVVEAAPEGSRVQTLLLDALVEHVVGAPPGTVPARGGRTDEALERARSWVDANPGDARVHRHRNAIAFVLMRLHRGREAYEELLLIGPDATAYPWAYYGGDPRTAFLERRTTIATLAAAEG